MNRTGQRSITARIAALGAAVAAVTALVSASAPFLVLALRLGNEDVLAAERLTGSIEAGLEREAREEGSFLGAAQDVLEESVPWGARVEVWDGDGLVAAVGPGKTLGPGSPPPAPQSGREGSRTIARRWTSRGPVIAVALPVSLPSPLRRQMVWALLLAVVPLSGIAALLAARLTRRALRPLRVLADAVGAQRPSGQWEPLTAPSRDLEISTLTTAFNEAGTKLASALAAERELSAYASHALRTPLTRLAARTADSAPEVRGAVLALQRLVDGLLVLVRTDARPGVAGTTINAADLLRKAARNRDEDGRRVLVDAPDEALVRGDEELLAAAVEHLVDNAFAYAMPSSPIRLSAEVSESSVVLAVADEGPGLSPSDRERVFEPFVRGSSAGAIEGSGLGLALVRRIAAAHGGLARAVAAGAGTRFEIVLPSWMPR
ncbi:MAG: sensor histidine kinase [Thermoanaerobaculia bacterium]